MSRLTPGPDRVRVRHGAIFACPDQEPAPDLNAGWCLPCYEDGAFTLASGPASSTCVLHGGLLTEEAPSSGAFGRRGDAGRHTRAPRGRGFRGPDHGPSTGPGRSTRPSARARSRARALERGRARARRRLRDRTFCPHPGWRNFIAPDYRVVTSQCEAWQHIGRLVDREEWRSDKRHSWTRILRQLVRHMDWDTGLITGVTAERLGAAGQRAPRTVSRVLAWARDVGLVVVVECGASAEFLDSDTGRTPTYALVTRSPGPGDAVTSDNVPVDETGDLPTSNVGSKPLSGDGRPQLPPRRKWPSHSVPDNPVDRNAATLTVLSHLGLGGRKAPKIEIWRARALLRPWWEAGASVAGVLYALEHHPDRRDRPRGDVAQGARDPLRIIGARLRPWSGRLRELPASAVGHRTSGNEPARTPPVISVDRSLLDRPAGRAARQAAREALSVHLEQLRQRRRTESK